MLGRRGVTRGGAVFGFVCSTAIVSCGGGLDAPRAPVVGWDSLPAGYCEVPAPSDDASLLGRVVDQAPQDDHPFTVATRANPCGDFLEGPSRAPAEGNYESARSLTAEGRADVFLAPYGFQGSVQNATYVASSVQTDRVWSLVDSEAYRICCALRNCGFGFVGHLLSGKGTYAAGYDAGAATKADFVVGKAGGALNMKTVAKRTVAGFLAASVTKTPTADPLQDNAALEALVGEVRLQNSEPHCARADQTGETRCEYETRATCNERRHMFSWSCIEQPRSLFCRASDNTGKIACYSTRRECVESASQASMCHEVPVD